MTRAVIVGAGLMGRWHAHACRAAGGRLVAVVDTDEAAARALAARHDAIWARNIEEDELARRTDIDVIHICTPAQDHERDVTRALSFRRPLIVEKPLARTASATEQVLAAARDAGTWIQPVHQLLFQDGVRHAQEWITRGGVIRLVDYHLCSTGASTAAASADTVVADVLPHPLSLIERLLPGGLASVQSWKVDRPSVGELSAVGVAGETVCRLSVSMHGRPPRHELVLVADGGTLTADLFHGFAWTAWTGTSHVHKALRPLASAGILFSRAALNLARRAWRREPAFPGLAALIAEAYRAAGTPGAPSPIGDAQTLAVARARDDILGVVA